MDDWKWSKFFDLSPNRFGKDVAILIRFAIIICVISLAVIGIIWIKGKMSPQVTPDIVSAETANIDKSSKEVKNTFFPFSGWFGSSGKVRDYE